VQDLSGWTAPESTSAGMSASKSVRASRALAPAMDNSDSAAEEEDAGVDLPHLNDLNAHIVKVLETDWASSGVSESETAEAFLFRNGLAIDLAHAMFLAANIANRDFAQVDAEEPQMVAFAMYKDIFPGLVKEENARGQEVCYGHSIMLNCSSHWVLKRSLFKPAVNVPRSWFAKLDLCIHANSTHEGAKSFNKREYARRFVITRINEVQDEPVSDLGGALAYGEEFELRDGALRARVRFVCPGRSGPVKYLDHAFIVDTNNLTTWELHPRTKFGGVVPIQLGKVKEYGQELSPLCVTIYPHDSSLEPGPVDLEKVPASFNLNVLAYNCWMMPSFYGIVEFLNRKINLGLSYRKLYRAAHIPESVLDNIIEQGLTNSTDDFPDVIVLNEVFAKVAGQKLKAGLKRRMGAVFETHFAGSGVLIDTARFLNSGVTVLSRYPIVDISTALFRPKNEYSGSDGLANKAALFVRVNKEGRRATVIASHLQAWDNKKAMMARENQMLHLRRSIQEKQIPETEPVIIAGDLNADRIRSPFEYLRMLDILKATDTNSTDEEIIQVARDIIRSQREGKEASPPHDEIPIEDLDEKLRALFTFNVHHNKLSSDGPSTSDNSALLDYILVSTAHLQPKRVEHRVLYNLAAESPFVYNKLLYSDLSDHYPVISKMTF